MGFIYPRTIKITRPAMQTGVGLAPAYAADLASKETVVACDIRCSIQVASANESNKTELPADGKASFWRVLTPKRALSDGQVRSRDLITDDLGRRFQVSADYTNSLGANFYVERLEA